MADLIEYRPSELRVQDHWSSLSKRECLASTTSNSLNRFVSQTNKGLLHLRSHTLTLPFFFQTEFVGANSIYYQNRTFHRKPKSNHMMMDVGTNSSQRSVAHSSRTQSSSLMQLLCGCERFMVRRIAQTAANRGRPFFACSLMKVRLVSAVFLCIP